MTKKPALDWRALVTVLAFLWICYGPDLVAGWFNVPRTLSGAALGTYMASFVIEAMVVLAWVWLPVLLPLPPRR